MSVLQVILSENNELKNVCLAICISTRSHVNRALLLVNFSRV